MKMHFALLALVLLTGCRFGSAQFEGEINGHDFDATGTVFSFEDRTDEQGLIRDEPILHVVMMYIAIDPTEDLSQQSGDELDRLRHENSQRDLITLSVTDPNRLVVGETLEQERTGLEFNGSDGFAARAQRRDDVLDNTSTFADFVPYGSREVIRFSPLAFDDDQALSGDVSVEILREEGDAANARTALINGEFTAPRISEAIAEKNIRTLRIPLSAAAAGGLIP